MTKKPQHRTAEQMGRPLTAVEMMDNLYYAMTHCDECNGKVPLGSPVCEHCGYELMEYGKH